MKTLALGLTLSLSLLTTLFITTETRTKPAAPPAGSCYLPGGGGCGTSTCHNVATNVGPGNVAITYSGSNSEYVPGSQYSITVSVNDNSLTRFGFQAAMVDANNNSVGTLAIVNTTTTSTQSASGKNYIGHKSANSTSSWTFNWTAPSSDVGPLKLYVAGMAANNNGNENGDRVYTNQLPLTAAQGVGIASVSNDNNIKLLSQDYGTLTIDAGSTSEPRTISLMSINGQVFYQNQIAAGENIIRIPCNDLTAGIYIIHCGQQNLKFVKP